MPSGSKLALPSRVTTVPATTSPGGEATAGAATGAPLPGATTSTITESGALATPAESVTTSEKL